MKTTQTFTLSLFFVCIVFMLAAAFRFPAMAQEQDTFRGQQVFRDNCTRCHGKNGNKGFLGAKDLTKSSLSREGAKKIILEGKGLMPSWKKRLTVSEIDLVIVYILTLRNP